MKTSFGGSYWLQLCYLLVVLSIASSGADEYPDDGETFKTLTYRDANDVEHEEYAFREPMKGVPKQIINLYCANVKLRLYWRVFREEVTSVARKGIFLRRMARLARHLFDEIKDVDKPFDAPRLSEIDEYFPVKDSDPATDDEGSNSEASDTPETATSQADEKLKSSGVIGRIRSGKNLIKKKLASRKSTQRLASFFGDPEQPIEMIKTSSAYQALERSGAQDALKKLTGFVREMIPKLLLGAYTRWRTMWWMMMSCLFTKYYLWDPALDEFEKLKQTLVMYPEFQLMRLQDLDCKPVKFFARLIDVCKVLNPLFNIDFGQLSLDTQTRFKKDLD